MGGIVSDGGRDVQCQRKIKRNFSSKLYGKTEGTASGLKMGGQEGGVIYALLNFHLAGIESGLCILP